MISGIKKTKTLKILIDKKILLHFLEVRYDVLNNN